MIRREQPTEANACTFDALVLITSVSIQLWAHQIANKENYFFRSIKHTQTVGEELTQAFFLMPELALPYHSLKVFVDFGSAYVLVPDDFTQQGMNPHVWLGQQTALDESDKLMVEPVPDNRYSIVYSLPSEAYEFCSRSFVVPQFNHPVRPILEMAIRQSRLADATTITVDLHDEEGYIDVILIVGTKLRLANRYTVRDEVDALYYITSLWRQHEMTTGRDRLYLYGNAGSSIFEKLVPHLESSIPQLYVNDYSSFGDYSEVIREYITAEPKLSKSLVFSKLV